MMSPATSIRHVANRCHELAVEKGWHDAPRELGTEIALMHSELSEALEEVRNDKPHFYVEDGKPEGLAVELADCVIRIFDTAVKEGIDIEEAIFAKMAYNAGREYRHGGKQF